MRLLHFGDRRRGSGRRKGRVDHGRVRCIGVGARTGCHLGAIDVNRRQCGARDRERGVVVGIDGGDELRGICGEGLADLLERLSELDSDIDVRALQGVLDDSGVGDMSGANLDQELRFGCFAESWLPARPAHAPSAQISGG